MEGLWPCLNIHAIFQLDESLYKAQTIVSQ